MHLVFFVFCLEFRKISISYMIVPLIKYTKNFLGIHNKVYFFRSTLYRLNLLQIFAYINFMTLIHFYISYRFSDAFRGYRKKQVP